MTLSGPTCPVQSGPESNVNEGVLCTTPNSSITGALSSDCLISYSRHLLDGIYSFAEIQSVDSTAPVNWTRDNGVDSLNISLMLKALTSRKKDY